MEINQATAMLSALAQVSRMSAFRLLVKVGSQGLPAGDIAEALAIPHNTLSTHLAILSRAGLLRWRRDGRSVIYRVDFDGTRALLGFLLEDCCQGTPEVCNSLLDTVLTGCCESG
jgi:DNA-binding transcriptional ArsR family regulator